MPPLRKRCKSMQLNVIGSGSSGNGYVLQNDNEALIIECGMPLKDATETLGNNLRKVVGCLVTHSHSDHAGYIQQYARHFNIFATKGTFEEKGVKDGEFHYNAVPLLYEFKVGNFIIKPFDTVHDTKEPCGFIIYHPDMGDMLFLTDSHHIKYKFSFPFDYIIIECNHTDILVDKSVKNGVIPMKVGNRAKATHMSLERCIRCLKENQLQNTKAVILVHISANNGNTELFTAEVAKATGKAVYVAKKGFMLELFK